MSLEVYYPQDIRNALLAAEQASSAALVASCEERNDFAQGYEAGYRAALTTIALAFGLVPPTQKVRRVARSMRHELGVAETNCLGAHCGDA